MNEEVAVNSDQETSDIPASSSQNKVIPKRASTKSGTAVFGLGFHQSKIISTSHPNQLPTAKEVLLYLMYRKRLPAFSNKVPIRSVVSCPFMTGTFVAKCTEPGGCCADDGKSDQTKCLIAALKLDGNWLKSGLKMMSDKSIVDKAMKLNDRHVKINKQKHLQTPKEIAKRTIFKADMMKLFDIADKNLISGIKADLMRSDEAKQEDIDFYLDQCGPRIGAVTDERDTDLDESWAQKIYKAERPVRMKQKENKESNNNVEQTDQDDDDMRDDSDDSDDSDDNAEKDIEKKLNRKRKRSREDFVTLQVPRKRIANETAICAKRFKISISGQVALTSNFINSSGGDLNDFSVSRTTVWRQGQSAISDAAGQVREKFENIKDGKLLTVHLDMKAVQEITKGRKLKQDRLALVVSSAVPKFEQLLGIPHLETATGARQCDEVINILEEWGLVDKIIAISFDTTSDNTGKHKGSCTFIEDCVGQAVLWLACRRHVYELHIKHVASLVAETKSARPSTAPEETLFKRLRDNWGDLTEDDEWLNMEDLTKFDWKANRSKFMQEQAKYVFSFLEKCLKDETFPRSDYKEMCVLCFVWLGGEVPNFRFRWPGACHRARFMMQAIYYMKYELLDKFIYFVNDMEKTEIHTMAEFVGLFYCMWFLRCAMGAAAPNIDLQNFVQMQKYKKLGKTRAEVAEACMLSMVRHSWYLDPSLVVMALADKDVPNHEKKSMAAALVGLEKPAVFDKGKPCLDSLQLGKKVPTLTSLIRQRSWLMFSLRNMTEVELAWLKQDVALWSKDPGFVRFSDFVKGLNVVNDSAERSIKLIQEYINTCQDEELRQDLMLAVAEDRKVHTVTKKENLAKIGKK